MAGSGKAHLRNGEDVLLRAEDVVVEFPAGPGQVVHAVSGISIDVRKGETLGLVGESGCGKSTLSRAIMQLPRPTSGTIAFAGTDLTRLKGERLRQTRSRLQMILQDPISSLNPRRKVRDTVAEGLRVWRRAGPEQIVTRVHEVLEAVGLAPDVVANRRPSQLSGGQCQRVSLARALVLEPEVIICDEPVSSLDVSVQAQIINLLEDAKARFNLTLIFIAHDLVVVEKNISDRIVVMYLGKICEVGTPDEIFACPSHHYTRLLLAAIPRAQSGERHRRAEEARLETASTELPSPINPPSGCRFRTRCPAAQERCVIEEPQIREVRPNHFIACHFPAERPRAVAN